MLIEHDELRHYWYVVAEGHDLDSAPLAVRLLGADYVVWRSSNGELVAAPDRCPHRESPLSIGTVADGIEHRTREPGGGHIRDEAGSRHARGNLHRVVDAIGSLVHVDP